MLSPDFCHTCHHLWEECTCSLLLNLELHELSRLSMLLDFADRKGITIPPSRPS